MDHEIIRSMIQHENQLINERLTWLLTFQGLLLASLGFCWGRRDSKTLVTVFGLLGIAVSLMSATGLFAATAAMYGLWEWWREHRPSDYAGPDVIGMPPATVWLRYATPWNLFPAVFVAGWAAILWVNGHRARRQRAAKTPRGRQRPPAS